MYRLSNPIPKKRDWASLAERKKRGNSNLIFSEAVKYQNASLPQIKITISHESTNLLPNQLILL